ncbi:MAG: alpha amylase N-terminal ig-like domain-containing protein [Psychrilyobacter sp.]|uniref:alpha amylase N-terminal ig-like domain-containing protein n=1 Tax=Psychrilyobacter sp. TaxID=2586924 RepID=UPI003C78231E
MKKWLIIMGMALFIGCSNGEILKIEKDTPIPVVTNKGDSYIFLDDLDHRSTTKYMVYDGDKKQLEILIRVRKNDIEKINLVLDGDKKEMESLGFRGDYEYFSVEIEKISKKKISYYFEVIDGKFRYFYGEKPSYYLGDTTRFTYTIEDKQREIPAWANGMVWYSIYVDSFRDGDKKNSPIYSEFGPGYYFRPSGRLSDGTLRSELIPPEKWQTNGTLQGFEVTNWGHDWNTPPHSEIEAKNRYFSYAEKNTRRYGGDLKGIMEKLDYLKKLGVEGIKLSPIYYSNSSHKLDTIDYGHISPDYGITDKSSYIELEGGLGSDIWTDSDKLFQNLVDKIHKKNMRVVLDINFSYVSSEFFAYKDLLKNRETSKYKNWFILEENQLSKNKNKKILLNLDDESLQNYLIESTTKWVKGYKNKGIDGYYVKNNLTNKIFLTRWKKALLKVNSEFILVGESTGENENNLGEDGFDIIGSYELGAWIQGLFGSSKSIEMVKGGMKVYSIKTPRWNFIESYDTDRFYSSLINPNREFDRLNSYGRDDYINIRPDLVDKNAIKKLKLATLIQLTIDGSPIIYYGNEKAMWGADSPDSRKPMIWDDIKFENETDSLKKYSKNREKIAKIFKTDLIKDEISYDVVTNKTLEDWYKQISEFRNFDEKLMKNGNLEILDLDRDQYLEGGSVEKILETNVLSYKREYKGRSAIIVINRSDLKKTVELPVQGGKGYTDYYSGKRYNVLGDKVKVEIEGYGYLILYRRVDFD